MSQPIAGPAAAALASLSTDQVAFIQSLPKAELHAHLNGSIPLPCLQELAREYAKRSDATQSTAVQSGLEKLQKGVDLNAIDEFFGLFPAIYALTSTPKAVARVSEAVLSDFLDGERKQCSYLELRSTPRRTEHMTRMEYVEAVLEEVEKYSEDQAALIISLDRRMTSDEAEECIDIVLNLKAQGRRIVGVDLCGEPLSGDMKAFTDHFSRAKAAGLGITLHVAETASNLASDTLQLLSFKPDRLGHATFLNDEAKKIVFEDKICVEICLTSNLLCKTVKTLSDHHVLYHLKLNHPVVICTDDTLPFRNSLAGEYALLMATPPLGLGLKENEVERLAQMSMEHTFKGKSVVAAQPVTSAT